jgi:hypothetical protein
MGVELLGSQYMQAYEYYFNEGEHFFKLASQNKGILPAAKESYIIAATNLNYIMKHKGDEYEKAVNKKKLGELLSFVE